MVREGSMEEVTLRVLVGKGDPQHWLWGSGVQGRGTVMGMDFSLTQILKEGILEKQTCLSAP